ncbi:MAG: hypothetical protein R2851_14730 [Caldilineaceae bacterium]
MTARNLDQLVTTFQDAGVTVLLAGMEMVENMGGEYTSAFRASTPPSAPPMTCGSSPSCWRRCHRPRAQSTRLHPPQRRRLRRGRRYDLPYVTDLLARLQPQD